VHTREFEPGLFAWPVWWAGRLGGGAAGRCVPEVPGRPVPADYRAGGRLGVCGRLCPGKGTNGPVQEGLPALLPPATWAAACWCGVWTGWRGKGLWWSCRGVCWRLRAAGGGAGGQGPAGVGHFQPWGVMNGQGWVAVIWVLRQAGEHGRVTSRRDRW